MKRILIILFWIISISLNATNYYVSTTGNDSSVDPTNIATPWLTWNKAFTSAVAGDTVFFRGGVYYTTITNGRGIMQRNNGTADNWICFFAYPDDYADGNYPILDCSTSTATYDDRNNFGVRIYYTSYIHIKGLRIRNVKQRTEEYDLCYALYCEYNNHLKLENMVVHNSDGHAIDVSKPYYAEVINCDAYDCCDYYHQSAVGNWGTGFAGGNQVFQDGYLYYYGCRAWNCSDQGFAQGASESLTVFENCWSFNNGKMIGNTTGDGIGFKLGYLDHTTVADPLVVVKNCIAANNGRDATHGDDFTLNDRNHLAASIHIYNNLSYKSGRFGFAAYNTISSDEDELKRIFRNNIAYESNNTDMYLAPNALYVHSNNTWDHTVTVTDDDFVSLDWTQLYRPRKADGSLPDITFGRLAASSDLINAGENVGLPFNGSAPDLGAFEYSEFEEGVVPYLNTNEPIFSWSLGATSGGNMIDAGGGTISRKGICWSTDANPDINDNVVEGGVGMDDFISKIWALKPNTTYHVRAFATNEYGTGYGADVTFTTPIRSFGVKNKKIIKLNGKIVII